jgi:hypothetical protein
LKHQLSFSERLGGSSSVSEGGVERGRLRVDESEFSYAARLPVSSSLSLMAGAGYRRTELTAGSAPLPSLLQAASARLGVEWLINPRWWAFVNVNPGLYGDGRLDGSAFNAPADLQVNYLRSPGLRLVAGLSVDAFTGSPATPFAGAVWRVSRRWNLNLLPPRLRVEYRALDRGDKRVELFSGLAFAGGSHRVSSDFGTRRGRPELDGRRLTRREAAAEGGVSLDWRGARTELSGGWQFQRRFKYEGAGVELKADGAPYFAVSVSGRL